MELKHRKACGVNNKDLPRDCTCGTADTVKQILEMFDAAYNEWDKKDDLDESLSDVYEGIIEQLREMVK